MAKDFKVLRIFESFLPSSSNPRQAKILKSLKFLPFDSLIENRKFPKFQFHSPSGSDFVTILETFSSRFEDKMCFGAFSGYP